VLVNRVWLHLFGEALVRSVDNFGVQGERPTHPELLDDLAVRFVQGGWSVKKLVRLLVLSRAYRMAGRHDARAARLDPENRLLWRANRRRLEAEVIRDGMLAVAGRLDRSLGGSSVANLGEVATSENSTASVSTDHLTRRSVYLPIIRNDLPAIFEVFDFANPDVSIGKRDATTVPTQALYLMNSPFVAEQSRATAARLLRLPAAERLPALYHLALGRNPNPQERASVKAFLRESRRTSRSGPSGSLPVQVRAWAAVCQAVFASTEFRFVE
jgi:hypothetical protein